MARSAGELAFSRQEAKYARAYAANVAANETRRVRAVLQYDGVRRRLTAAEAALAYDPAENAVGKPRGARG